LATLTVMEPRASMLHHKESMRYHALAHAVGRAPLEAACGLQGVRHCFLFFVL
jgi:hypothetical protein